MDELPKQKLCEIITRYGRSVCDDPRRCEGLLRDYCGQYRREVSVLVSALKERVPADLMGSQNSAEPYPVVAARLTNRLKDNLALNEGAARWAIETWSIALGVSQESAPLPVSSDPDSYPTIPDAFRQENVFRAEPSLENDFIVADSSPGTPIPASRNSQPLEYAGFWVRFTALFIDGIILYIIGFVVGLVVFGLLGSSAEGLATLLGIIINWLYYALSESSPKQATLGKQAMEIVVTDINDNRISFLRATARHFSKIPSFMLIFGPLLVVTSDRKQALHDMMANTLIVKKH